MTTNQITMIGPKNAATRAVPRDCAANSPARMTIVRGSTNGSNFGDSTLQAFDRRQHRQRRRDHRVAIEQRAADDAEQRDRGDAAAERTLRQRHQRQRAALAIVVGAQQDHDIFQRDHDDQRPQDQRQHADDNRFGHGALGPGGRDDRLAQRVQRAGADVAVDDADAAERQRDDAAVVPVTFHDPVGRLG